MDRNGSDSFHCHIGVPLLFLFIVSLVLPVPQPCLPTLEELLPGCCLGVFSHQWYLFQVPIGAAIFPFTEQYAEGGTNRWNLV